MLKIIAFAVVVGLAAGQSAVNYDICKNIDGRRGGTRKCPDGYVAVGLCSSGIVGKKCWGTHMRMKCCQVHKPEGTEVGKTTCRSRGRQSTGRVQCSGNGAITSFCTSGWKKACSKNASKISCCDGLGLTIDRDVCKWNYARRGFLISCAPGYVMAGACSSSLRRKCKKHWMGIKCCAVSSTKQPIVEQPEIEQPKIEQPKIEQPKIAQIEDYDSFSVERDSSVSKEYEEMSYQESVRSPTYDDDDDNDFDDDEEEIASYWELEKSPTYDAEESLSDEVYDDE